MVWKIPIEMNEDEMLYRTVPKNGDKLSILGFGAMRLPGRGQRIDEKRAERQIYSAIDQGVNYIDTAYPYHMGKSEPFLGKILSKNRYRKKVKLATKLPHWSTKNISDMNRILDDQLKRLQTDVIDYYLIHNFNGHAWNRAREKGVLQFLDDALKSGKILNAGFSYHGSAKDFKKVIDGYGWTFCQVQYNYLDTKNQAGTAGVKYAAERNIAVIAMEPLRGGNLSKKPPKEVQQIWDESDTKQSAAEWALRWIWDQPEVTLVLSGMNEEKHISENINIAKTAHPESLTDRDRKLVDRAASTFQQLMRAGCTGCQYCMPCPAGVNIPTCFEYYNSYHTFNDKSAKLVYGLINGGLIHGKPAFASQCIGCGKCLKKCPQGLDIPALLDDVKKDMEGPFLKPMIWITSKVMRIRH